MNALRMPLQQAIESRAIDPEVTPDTCDWPEDGSCDADAVAARWHFGERRFLVACAVHAVGGE